MMVYMKEQESVDKMEAKNKRKDQRDHQSCSGMFYFSEKIKVFEVVTLNF